MASRIIDHKNPYFKYTIGALLVLGLIWEIVTQARPQVLMMFGGGLFLSWISPLFTEERGLMMPAIRRYNVEITLVKKQVVAESAAQALQKVLDDLRGGPAIVVKTALVDMEG